MGDLLFYLMIYYRDIDIRDKVRFYYMLIILVIDEKVSVGILVELKMYFIEILILNMYLKMYFIEMVILNIDSFICFM